jgi:hypothetical protein
LTESSIVVAKWRGLSFTRERVIGVAAIVVLIVLGVVLPFVTITYVNDASESVVGRERLTGAGDLIGGIDPTYLPGYVIALRDAFTLGLNVVSFGIGLQQIGSIVAVATVVGQFFDEINKFLWWPLHLAGYLLVLAPVPLFVGVHLLQVQKIPIQIGPAWVPAALAGALALVMTFRSWKRIDTYSGI